MSKQSWKGSTLLNPEPPVLVSCGGLDKPNLITIGWTGTICTQPSMVSISVRPERYSHHLIQESRQFAINLPTEALVRAVDWCGVKSGRDVDKFGSFRPAYDENGVPYLPWQSCARLSGRVVSGQDLGSHTLFVAELEQAQVLSDREPLTYAYYQRELKPKPVQAEPERRIVGWRCRICGFVYDGPELPADYLCPLCGHPAEDFEPIYAE